ncbi:MAG: hypothetical protein ACR2KZ_19880 [Segetibacter sp.]
MIQLPSNIIVSTILTKDAKEALSNVEELPTINPSFEDDYLKNIIQYYSINPQEMDVEVQKYAAKLLAEGKVTHAWQVLLTTF